MSIKSLNVAESSERLKKVLDILHILEDRETEDAEYRRMIRLLTYQVADTKAEVEDLIKRIERLEK